MPVPPGAFGIDFLALAGHMPAGEVVLDEPGDRAVLDEGRENLDGQAQIAAGNPRRSRGTGWGTDAHAVRYH